MPINKQDLHYYKQTELWAHDDNIDQLIVAKDLVSLIPKQVKSVLDVGCGKGTVTNLISQFFPVIGTDISLEALKHITLPTVQSDICTLPFENDSFDLVLASDIIEHIPEESYSTALSELLRVSKRFVLISVPFMEILEALFTTCTKCGFNFHVNWHQRTYDSSSIQKLFEKSASLIKYKFSGASWAWSDKSIVKFKNSFLGCYFNHDSAVCPKCHTKQTRSKGVHNSENREYVERILESLQYQLVEKKIINRPAPSEIIALYDKQAENEIKIDNRFNRIVKKSQIKLRLNEIPKVDYIPNYPSNYLISSIEKESWVLVLPNNYNQLSFTRNEIEESILVEIYDFPHGKYYPLYQYDTDKYLLGNFNPSIKGYFLKFNCPLDVISEIILA